MAERSRRKRHYCEPCEVGFDFPFKYARHLQSRKHKITEGLVTLDAPEGKTWEPQGSCREKNTDSSLQSSILKMQDALHPNTIGIDDGCEATWEAPDYDDTSEESEEEVTVHEQSGIEYLLSTAQGSTPTADYHPFRSKSFALLYLALNSPRPISEKTLSFFTFICKELDSTAPSLSQLKTFQLPGATVSQRCQTSSGVPFYVNLPSSVVARCLSNPVIAQAIHRYPVLTDGPYTEIFEARRWHTDPRFHSPMISQQGCDIFIGDLVWHDDPSYGDCLVEVTKFVVEKQSGTLVAVTGIKLVSSQLAGSCHSLPPDTWVLLEEERGATISCHLLLKPSPPPSRDKIVRMTGHGVMERITDEEWSHIVWQHPLKAAACGLPVVVLPLLLFSDDVRGNLTRKWNGFDVWYLLFGGLTWKENAQLRNIHYLACSNSVSAIDMAEPIVQDLEKLESEGVTVYDGHLQRKVLVVAPVLCGICDNPRASLLTNHMGSTANRYCRMCLADQTVCPTRVSILRSKTQALKQIAIIQNQHTARDKIRKKTKYGLKDDHNPLFRLSVDMYKSLPVECLHTILLGPYKYLVADLMGKLTTQQKEEVLARIQAFDFSGVRGTLLGNICRYYQSFVGRDYKCWAQICLFIVWDFLSPIERTVWLNLSKVFKIAYCDQFDPINADEVRTVCQEFVTSICDYNPDMLRKPKIHTLLHLADSMVDFGPTAAYNAERCESYNGIIRQFNVHSNHRAPSRDICRGLTTVEHLQLLCSGGMAVVGGRDIEEFRCGDGLAHLVRSTPVQTFLYGPTPRDSNEKTIYQPGALRKKRGEVLLELGEFPVILESAAGCSTELKLLELPSHSYILCLKGYSLSTLMQHFGALVDSHQELVNEGDHVAFMHDDKVEFAMLLACCHHLESGQAFCILQLFEREELNGQQVVNDRNCPMLHRLKVIYLVPSTCIITAVSIVHSCSSDCEFVCSGVTPRVYERESVQLSSGLFKHVPWHSNNSYCLNVYSLKVFGIQY